MSKRRNLLDSAEKRRSLQNVAVARGRLKGALQHIVTHTDDDESNSDDPSTSLPSKRSKPTLPDAIPIPHQSYIMKLFDRSVDLARFDGSSPLYPICRAWMQNQPRLNPGRLSRMPVPVKREHNPEMVEQYRNRELKEIWSMPKPEPAAIERIPSPLECQKVASKDRIDLEAEPVPKAILMAEHKLRWAEIRRKRQLHAECVGQRYAASFELLVEMLRETT
ncbi:protein lin-37 homolog [Toxorhynchites rutilus septentrionalis]|uniref:protein lin-37 homolog n=1 Tax=Toxorhynchites rutilus septentrionalis TaxID=329112 RepID=UPI00247A3C86|nr:protein lin-37 homolog [Toxorhynchites rutilus septentrionalis]